MPTSKSDKLFELAAKRVEHKSFTKRVQHSSTFHNWRSAWSSSGSRKSKAVGVASSLASSALKTLPIPAMLTNAIDNAKNALIKHKKQQNHENQSAAAAQSLKALGYTPGQAGKNPTEQKAIEQIVKFDIKELSIDNLDRYRWKVHNSMEQVVAVYNAFEKSHEKAASHAKPCDALLEMAEAIMQARRRVETLKGEMEKLAALSSYIESWLAKQTAEINVYQAKVKEKLKVEYNEPNMEDERHKHCGAYCWLANKAKLTTTGNMHAKHTELMKTNQAYKYVNQAVSIANTLVPITGLVKIELDEDGAVKVSSGIDVTWDTKTQKGVGEAVKGLYNSAKKTANAGVKFDGSNFTGSGDGRW